MPMRACALCHLTDETRAIAGPRAPLPCACNAAVCARIAVDAVDVSRPATKRGAAAFADLVDQDRYTVAVPTPMPVRTP